LGVGQRPDRGLHPLGEERQHVGIEEIGLRQLAGRFREVAHLAGVGDDDREAVGDEGGHTHKLIAAGRFEHDELRRHLTQARDKRGDARLVIRHCPALPAGPHGDDQLGLGDIDSELPSCPLHEEMSPGPGLVYIRARPGGRPPQLFGLWQREIRDAAPANARCLPPRRHRAGARIRMSPNRW